MLSSQAGGVVRSKQDSKTFQLEAEGLRVSKGEDEDVFAVALAGCGMICRYWEDRLLT
jgi:hypothetical protein